MYLIAVIRFAVVSTRPQLIFCKINNLNSFESNRVRMVQKLRLGSFINDPPVLGGREKRKEKKDTNHEHNFKPI